MIPRIHFLMTRKQLESELKCVDCAEFNLFQRIRSEFSCGMKKRGKRTFAKGSDEEKPEDLISQIILYAFYIVIRWKR
jgi:hypothetical protein